MATQPQDSATSIDSFLARFVNTMATDVAIAVIADPATIGLTITATI